jgi:hypothetical protein
MNWFLTAKHWQLFLLTFVFPICMELTGMIIVFITREPMYIFPFFFLIMIVAMGTQFGWFYCVGKALGQKLPPNAGMNLNRFLSFVMVPIIYFGLLFIAAVLFGVYMLNVGEPSPFFALIFIIVIPLHFFSIFCIFYTFWFIAKSLKMVESWKQVTFGDYAGDFFLIWFFFVGVWFIQPRINRIFDPSLPPLMTMY